MDRESLPYVPASGNITKVLNKIQEAETPSRFSQDYLATVLQMPGGSSKPVIPFLKKTGFLGSDGTPTELYKRFRGSQRGAAAAEALKIGYKPLYRANEYAHKATDPKLKDLIIQVTGAQKGAKTVSATAASFNALKAFATFSSSEVAAVDEPATEPDKGPSEAVQVGGSGDGELTDGLRLSYTINLHLPPSSDIAVFDAIFRSLKEHLVR